MFPKKVISMLLTIIFMAGCSVETQSSENILGLWKNISENNTTEKNANKIKKNTAQNIVNDTANDIANSVDSQYYYFAKDGIFALPEQSVRTGISWEISKDDVLSLVSNTVSVTPAMPSAPVNKDFFKIVMLEKNKMVLQDTNGMQITFERMKDTVAHVSGNVMYRERMALPPQVETQVKLYADGKLFATSFSQSKGQVPLPFSVYFIERNKDTQITLNASIYNRYTKLFGTIEPVIVGAEFIGTSIQTQGAEQKKAEQKELSVLLYRSENIENVPLPVVSPAAYKSKDGEYTLYLEADGFGILKNKKSTETIHWNQVGRNHNVEIIRGEKNPLLGAVQVVQGAQGAPSENNIIFDQLDGKKSVVFSPMDTNMDTKFSTEKLRMDGMYTEMGSKGYFTDCNSRKQFVLDFAKNPELHKAYLNLGAKVGFATLDALISRDDAGALNINLSLILSLSVEKLISLEKGKKCNEAFQNAELTNTYWRLITLNGKAVQQYPDQKEAHLIIRDDLANGSDTCNNFFMPVTVTGEKLKFGMGGSTMMMCPQGDAQSREFLQTLNMVDSWEINGSTLQLEKGEKKLTFEVVYF